MRSFFQFLFVANILLNLTNLFVFIPTWLGLSLSFVGGLGLIVNCCYLASERAILSTLLHSRLIWFILLLLLLWPITASLYPMFNGVGLAREVVLQLFYTTTLLGTVVFTLKRGFERFRDVFFFSFVVTLIGLCLQAFLPSAFVKVASLSDGVAEVFAFGRVGGFFVNPNVAARFIIFFYIILMMTSKKLSNLQVLLVTLLAFGAVMLTVSRSSLVIMFVTVLLVLGQRFGAPYIKGRMAINPVRLLLGLSLVIVAAFMAITALIIASNYILNETNLGSRSGTAKRFELMSGGVDGFKYVIEEEIRGRWYTVEPYIDGFKESWFLGSGLAGHRIYMVKHFIPLVPHNTIFCAWFDYGILYILSGCICFGIVAFSPRMRFAESYLGLFFMPIMFIVCMSIMFTYDALFAQRGFYVMVGGIVALYLAPTEWFQFNTYVAEQPLFRRFRRRAARKLTH